MLELIHPNVVSFCFFFFQAEDGIRDIGVTGVQTCALPICGPLTDAACRTRQFRCNPCCTSVTRRPSGRDGSTPPHAGARVTAVSHPQPGTVVVRTLAEHPMVEAGGPSALRMVAPGSHTAGRFGLVEYRLAPHSPGAAPHYHQTFCESFYVLAGRLTVYADGAWRPYSAGDFAPVP